MCRTSPIPSFESSLQSKMLILKKLKTSFSTQCNKMVDHRYAGLWLRSSSRRASLSFFCSLFLSIKDSPTELFFFDAIAFRVPFLWFTQKTQRNVVPKALDKLGIEKWWVGSNILSSTSDNSKVLSIVKNSISMSWVGSCMQRSWHKLTPLDRILKIKDF